MIILLKYINLLLFSVLRRELEYCSRELIRVCVSRVVIVIFKYGLSNRKLKSWTTLDCLVRLMCLSKLSFR